MNKQAITFFSLFSLILVLSVYYVMIPPMEEVVEPVNEQINLQEKLNHQREEQTQTQQEILASSTSSGEALNEALEVIDEQQQAQNIEAKVTKVLNDLGYNEVFCELNETTLKVTITKKEATNQDAVSCMGAIDQICAQKYRPEIKFIDE